MKGKYVQFCKENKNLTILALIRLTRVSSFFDTFDTLNVMISKVPLK